MDSAAGLRILVLVKRITLNFHEIFLDRLRTYARDHGMKLNAVLKKAFELLESQGKDSDDPY